MTAPAAAATRRGRFDRLTSGDLMFLRLETEDWPCHFGGLMVLDGSALVDEDGRLRMREIMETLEGRLAGLPKLRSRIAGAGPLGGRPVWVEDDRFDLERHVHICALDPPGDEQRLLDTAAELYGRLLERDRPLWEMWVVTGLAEARVGVLLKLHHSVADGLGAMTVLGSLFELDRAEPVRPAPPTAPIPPPARSALVADNLRSKRRAIAGSVSRLLHPIRLATGLAAFLRMTGRFFGAAAAPGSSLNRTVRSGRRVRYVAIDLETARAVAHREGGKINDVVLALWSGGLRSLLAARGEPVESIELVSGMPVSHRSTGDVDNQSGTMAVRLPVWEPDSRARLHRIAAATRTAKAEQRSTAIMGYLAGLAATPIGRWFTTRQRASNTIVTNVMGPPRPVFLLGARVLEIIPIIQLVGNIGLTLCAFSYDGRISLVVTADSGAFPDIDVLVDGMAREWALLAPRESGPGETPGGLRHRRR